ncbi:MAG: hypothetical protein HZA60_04325 [Deltaproteobacteria bacterium]|nr:hypothetical protein [Deltaproteobacteria bacterium]
MAITKRTANDIRTNSGRVDQISVPYRAFMRIGALEMEKARRGLERKSAMQRIKDIDARFREIEAEKAALLETMGGRDRKASMESGSEPVEELRQTPKGFQIKY